MAKLVWDAVGTRYYETGVKQGVIYELTPEGAYTNGEAWSGLTSVSESPSGADETALWADDIKYLSLRASEEFGASIEAYTYPDLLARCDGTAELVSGVVIGQQTRKPFGFCFRSTLGNDVKSNDYGYKLHLIYNATVSPSESSYSTINDSPEANTFSWEMTTTPVAVTGFKPTSRIVIDSTKFVTEAQKDKLKAFEDVLYGTDEETPRMPLPDEVKTLLTVANAGG